ncbi:MAG: penicillin-binding protein activator [Gammaproteobacteria bacterium]|nr:MAG: penicillin-binding protein activator [Gammaproteobacteria bacterium]
MPQLRSIDQPPSAREFYTPHLLYVLLYALLSLFVLNACTGTLTKPGGPLTQMQKQALTAEQAGDHSKAAELYKQLAAKSTDDGLRYEWLIKAAQSYFRGGESEASAELLADLDVNLLDTQQLLQRQLLVAELALDKRDYARAQTALNFDIPEQTDTVTQQKIHKLRITTFNALNDPITAALSHIALDALIYDEEAQLFNQQTLWQLLQSAQIAELETAQANAFNSEVLGWLQLAIIAKRPAQQGNRSINDWRQFFPSHPADITIVDSVLARQSQQAYRPSNIALLLPLQGSLANTAKAIRDGFFAAYYQSDHRSTPSIRVYDVTTADGKIRDDVYTIYQNAVSDGAEFVIGPISKDALEPLAFRSDLSTPLLALNYVSDTGLPHDLFFQFGLSPEDEARQVAERAWSDGHKQAITLTPQGDWGQRMQTAFADRWESLGGRLVESKNYDANSNDFSRPLRSMLQLVQSQTRKRNLQQQLGLELNFEPRRRHDVDFIFLAAFPRQGRLLKPQLKFHHAGDIPVYASSHIFSGIADANADRDINGVTFCDTRWTIDPTSSSIGQQVTRLWPQNSHSLLRLYALGADAFKLIPHLSKLQQSESYSYQGQTGLLSMDKQRRLHRQPSWAKITNGVPVELAEPEKPVAPTLKLSPL